MNQLLRHAHMAGSDLPARFRMSRAHTLHLVAPLSPEDCQVQSMPEVSPAKWHLAHTSWFYETFLLRELLPDYRPFHPRFAELFNSYYVGVGARHPRAERGLLSRPSLAEVLDYRRHVEAGMARLFDALPPVVWEELVELGIQHEQQHQELILMDIQHVLSKNPLDPVYDPAAGPGCAAGTSAWFDVPGGLREIGYAGEGFAFDNEAPRHKVWLEPFAVFDRLVTNAEYAQFIADGGYRRPELWLSDGWAMVEAEGWQAPLYWDEAGGTWTRFSLAGRHAIEPSEPVLHVSHYEADAFARWAGCRLPTEAEWEVAAALHLLQQVDGCAWQWTASAYLPYPGFNAAEGAVGEYNGKFMSGQMVLRGGSFATPPGHARATYRNFFPPQARWMFSGIRLARS